MADRHRCRSRYAPTQTDRTGGISGAAKRGWRGVAAEPARNWVIPTASPYLTLRSAPSLLIVIWPCQDCGSSTKFARCCEVTPIACLEDNYAYLLDDGSGELAVVDVSESAPVLEALARSHREELSPRSSPPITTTITSAATTKSPRAPRAFASSASRPIAEAIPGQTEFLRDGETFKWGESEVRALHIPGHTLGAVAYVVEGRGLHRRHAVPGRMRPPIRGHAGHDAPLAERRARPVRAGRSRLSAATNTPSVTCILPLRWSRTTWR